MRLKRAFRVFLGILFLSLLTAPARGARIYEGPNGEIYMGDYLPRELKEQGYVPRSPDEEPGRKKEPLYPREGSYKNFLWKVQSRTTTVYVLGSIHVAKPGMYPLSPSIEEAYRKSGAIAVEANINMSHMIRNTSGIQKAFIDSALYPEGDIINNHISRKTYGLLDSRLRQMGTSLENMKSFRPWFLSMVLEGAGVARQGYSPEEGIDKYFLRKAEGRKKILELEGIDFQIEMFKRFTDKEQETMLLYTLQAREDSQVDDMVRAWARGDTRKMEELIFGDMQKDPELKPIFEKLFFERNRGMARKIEGYLAGKESILVIAGAGHMVGKRGIIQILRDKGYKVEQVTTVVKPAQAQGANQPVSVN